MYWAWEWRDAKSVLKPFGYGQAIEFSGTHFQMYDHSFSAGVKQEALKAGLFRVTTSNTSIALRDLLKGVSFSQK